MMTHEDSLRLVKQHVKNGNLLNHMIAVSAVMRGLAERLGEDLKRPRDYRGW